MPTPHSPIRPTVRWSFICIAAVLVCLQSVTAAAQPRNEWRRPAPAPPPPPGLWHKSITGGQLGPWFTDELGQDITESGYHLSASSTAFHLELFYQHPLVSTLYLDLNFGSVSRGDIRLTEEAAGVSTAGDATLYPIGAGLQWVPFAKSVDSKFQPLVRAGGSLIIGTERLETVYQDQFGYLVGISSESRVNLGFYAGAGALLVLGRQFALRGEIKYQHAKFSKELFGVRDYSGIQVLFGAAYLYR
jgi:hypothetical protein